MKLEEGTKLICTQDYTNQEGDKPPDLGDIFTKGKEYTVLLTNKEQNLFIFIDNQKKVSFVTDAFVDKIFEVVQ
jgi:hypothetical protein